MNARLLILPLVGAALLAVAPSALAQPAMPDAVPGEVLVRYQAGSSPAGRADVRERTGTQLEASLPGGSQKLEVVDGDSVRETISELRSDPRVDYAVPNYRARASGYVPNDRGARGEGDWRNLQWNFLARSGVNAPDAWQLARDAGAPGGRGVTVAVLDTGVAYRTRGPYRQAPDLASQGFARGYDFVSDDRFPDDLNGHGTHVAGTIAQRTNNRRGVTGLAYGARIMPLRVLDSRGVGDAADIARGIRFAARNGAKVINLSLEFDRGMRAAFIPDVVGAVRDANRRGVVVVGAAGNEEGASVAYPARTRDVISVGGTTHRLCQARYSSVGLDLDIVAPGGGPDAETLDNPWDVAHCKPGGVGRSIYQETYSTSITRFALSDSYQGTSMAAPHVSAAAALLVASGRIGRNPSPEAIERRLEATARDLGAPGPDRAYGAGLLDAAAALR